MPLDFQLLSQEFRLLHHGHVRRVHVHHVLLHRRGQSGHLHRVHLHHDRLHGRRQSGHHHRVHLHHGHLRHDRLHRHGHRGHRDHGRRDCHRQQGMSNFAHPFPNGFQDLMLHSCNSVVCWL